jgi:hypothetical protein
MTEPPESRPEPSAHPRLSGSALAGMAPWVQLALTGLGLLSALSGLRLDRDTILAALVRLGGFVLAGWLARSLLGAAAAALDLFAATARSTERMAGAAAELAAALERQPPRAVAREELPAAPTEDLKTLAQNEIRQAIRDSQWAELETRITTFGRIHGDLESAEGLARELAAAKEAATVFLQARVEAARSANDPDQAIEARTALVPLLRSEELLRLDQGLARWLMKLVQKRLRGGVMTAEVALLAARVVETFPATPDGASLRAALPTLRRSVGLCARCGQPYTGIADACPACLAHRPEPSASVAPLAREPKPPPAPEDEGTAKPSGTIDSELA